MNGKLFPLSLQPNGDQHEQMCKSRSPKLQKKKKPTTPNAFNVGYTHLSPIESMELCACMHGNANSQNMLKCECICHGGKISLWLHRQGQNSLLDIRVFVLRTNGMFQRSYNLSIMHTVLLGRICVSVCSLVVCQFTLNLEIGSNLQVSYYGIEKCRFVFRIAEIH